MSITPTCRCAAPESAATLGVRAEHLHLHRQEQAGAPVSGRALQATVRRIELLSDQRRVRLALVGGAAELVSAAPATGTLEPGSRVSVALDRPLWFDAAGRRVAA